MLEPVPVVIYPIQVLQHGAPPDKLFPLLAEGHVLLINVSLFPFFTLESPLNNLFDRGIKIIAVLAGSELLGAVITVVHENSTCDQFRRLAPIFRGSSRTMECLIFRDDVELKPYEVFQQWVTIKYRRDVPKSRLQAILVDDADQCSLKSALKFLVRNTGRQVILSRHNNDSSFAQARPVQIRVNPIKQFISNVVVDSGAFP